MLHPSDVATDYVAERLLESHFSAADAPVRDAVRRVRAAACHRQARPHSAAAQRFAASQRERIATLYNAHPHLRGALDEEEQAFEAILRHAAARGREGERDGDGH